ncbi:PRDM9 methyltransferase, partial [Atractosteus spatula]|nr:PRDM9 methyltransferase [Atractosteus spatula]
MALNEGDGNLDPGRHAQREAGRNPRCPAAKAAGGGRDGDARAESLSCRSARPGRSAAELGPGADLTAGESSAPVKRAREEALARGAQGPGPVIKRVFDQEWCSSLWSSAEPASESSRAPGGRVPRPDRRDAAHAGAGVSELRGATVKQEVDDRSGFHSAVPGSLLSFVQVKDERPDLGTARLYSARAHPAPGETRGTSLRIKDERPDLGTACPAPGEHQSLRVKENVSGLAGGPIKREAAEEELVQVSGGVCINAEDSRPDSRPQAERTPEGARVPASDRRTPGGARVTSERASESVPAQIKPFLRRVRYTVCHGPGAAQEGETGCKEELDREEGQGEPTVVVMLQTGAQAPCRTGSSSSPVRQMRTPRMRPLAPLNTPQGATETRLPTERGAEAGCGAERAGQSEGKRPHSESSEESSTTGGYCLRKKQRVDYSEEPELSDCSGLLDQEGRAKSSAEPTRPAVFVTVLSEDKRFQQQSSTASTASTASTSSTATTSSTPRENNPQKKRRVHFSELAESDEYFFCPECKFFFFEECEQHGPARFVEDTRAEVGLERRARLTLPPGLSLRDSSIPGAGLGVFNVDSLVPRGVHYGPYEGEPTSKEEATLSGYSWMIYKGKNQVEYIDAKSETSSNWMRFVNCARNEAEQNLVAFQYCGQILFRTCKAISPGCELLVCYGEEYARHLGITWDYIWERKCRPTGESLEEFPCPKCPVTFIAKFHFFKHIKRIHPQEYSRLMTSGSLATQSLEPPKRQQSPAVPEAPSSPAEDQSTEDIPDPLRCSHCGKRFGSERRLKTHQETHRGEGPSPSPSGEERERTHRCAQCGKSFDKLGGLKRHKHVHAAERP